MRRRLSRTRLVIIAAVLVLGLAAGAVAFWAGSGHGNAQTRVGDPLTLVLGPGVPTAQLAPGGSANVAVVATNPNPYTVHFATLGLDTGRGSGGFDVDAGHGGCNVATLAFVPQDNAGAGWTVPPRAGGTDGALPVNMADALTMSGSAANACQGAIFTVYLVAGA
jgi:hypothetical protein